MSDFSFLKERKYIFVYLALQLNKQNKYLDKLLKTYEEQKEVIKPNDNKAFNIIICPSCNFF